MLSNTTKTTQYLLIGFGLALAACSPAFAGGLEAGTDAATDFKTWFFGFLGVVAFIYLMIIGFQAWFDKKSWVDFGVACGKVAALGGVLGLVTYLWGIFA